jgi:hypothetical protein
MMEGEDVLWSNSQEGDWRGLRFEWWMGGGFDRLVEEVWKRRVGKDRHFLYGRVSLVGSGGL